MGDGNKKEVRPHVNGLTSGNMSRTVMSEHHAASVDGIGSEGV